MPSSIRIAAWNIGHQTKYKTLPHNLFDALKCLEADVIVLSEVVLARRGGKDNRSESLKADFERNLGMELYFPNATREESRDGFRNHTVIATRFPAVRSDLRLPPQFQRGTNFVHIDLPDHGFEVAGLRVPYWPLKSAELRQFWSWFEEMLSSRRGGNLIAIGDLNVDLSVRRNKVARAALERILAKGWHLPAASPDQWSYESRNGKTTQIDHAIESDRLKASTTYVASRENHTFASSECDMSDHAALLLELKLPGPSKAFLDRISDWTADNIQITYPDGTTNRTRNASKSD